MTVKDEYEAKYIKGTQRVRKIHSSVFLKSLVHVNNKKTKKERKIKKNKE